MDRLTQTTGNSKYSFRRMDVKLKQLNLFHSPYIKRNAKKVYRRLDLQKLPYKHSESFNSLHACHLLFYFNFFQKYLSGIPLECHTL